VHLTWQEEQSFVSSSRFLDQTIGGFRTRNYGFKIRLCHAVFKTPDYGVLYYTSDILGIITIHHGKSYEPTITRIFETALRLRMATDGPRSSANLALPQHHIWMVQHPH
jgi:hypothetical protein